MKETGHVGWLSALSSRGEEINDRRVGSGKWGSCGCVNIPELVDWWMGCEPREGGVGGTILDIRVVLNAVAATGGRQRISWTG